MGKYTFSSTIINFKKNHSFNFDYLFCNSLENNSIHGQDKTNQPSLEMFSFSHSQSA